MMQICYNSNCGGIDGDSSFCNAEDCPFKMICRPLDIDAPLLEEIVNEVEDERNITPLNHPHESVETMLEKLKIEVDAMGEESCKQLYNELLMAVSMKHPNETRHQTALRYIRMMENYDANVSDAGSATNTDE